jgi:hypothetical protein
MIEYVDDRFPGINFTFFGGINRFRVIISFTKPNQADVDLIHSKILTLLVDLASNMKNIMSRWSSGNEVNGSALRLPNSNRANTPKRMIELIPLEKISPGLYCWSIFTMGFGSQAFDA